ncbi:serine hydrolase domain-containing protein [Kitasatospora griseola]|uniref:serine hydrolase domain-containing protein n=1 Tax=Kitasatospora griseola TaxID=2064 RepID=UPI0019966DAC|nr:serine hydrolase domain-containing protein [Kitasatospora griseola]GGQ84493.1 serine hydrolase [Kitasatospora griseola]
MNPPPPYRRYALRRCAVPVAAGALLLGVLTPTAAGAAPATASAALATASAEARPADIVQQRLDALVAGDKLPAALAAVRGRDGRTRDYTSGVGDLATGAKVPVDGQVRIGSNTKTFVAVVVLQLVAEGRIQLDGSLDTYLPGLIHGDGIDGKTITVRQILQHTSGLADYVPLVDLSGPDQYIEPRELLDIALAHRPDFAPGDGWKYSNTGYLIAGLIIQKVTGRPVGEEITKRVIDRIGLRHTYFPAQGDMTVHERHPHGYELPEEPGGQLYDITEMDPSWAWAAGAMISTNTDLNRFFAALIGGRLLPPAQLAEMRTTVPAEYMGPGARYGLGLASRPLPCGGLSWGHGGSLPGYVTRGGVTEDGRAANIAVTAAPSPEARQRVADAVDAALCR